MPPLRIKLDARELERIKISSGEENIYAARKRLLDEIAATREAAEMAKGRGASGSEELSTNINNEIALRKELLQVEKSIAAEEKRIAADRERERKAALAHQEKAQDFVARFREQLKSEQEQNL